MQFTRENNLIKNIILAEKEKTKTQRIIQQIDEGNEWILRKQDK